jgi:RNA polymerase sigma-70 factor (ECF subfamily)
VNDVQPDRVLVDRFLRTREDSAFRELYRQHAGAVYAFVRRFIGTSDPEVPDLVQEVWSRAIDALPRFAWRSGLRTWLLGIAVNRCREHIRQRMADRASSQSDGLFRDPQADGVSLAAADRVDLERAVAALPAGYREVVVLHDIQGYTHDEIADILGVTTGTSKSQLSRARRALRAALAGGAEATGSEHDTTK